jgi:hypothetical protein
MPRRHRHASLKLAADTGKSRPGDMFIGACSEQFGRSHEGLRFPVGAAPCLNKHYGAAFRGKPFQKLYAGGNSKIIPMMEDHERITMP